MIVSDLPGDSEITAKAEPTAHGFSGAIGLGAAAAWEDHPGIELLQRKLGPHHVKPGADAQIVVDAHGGSGIKIDSFQFGVMRRLVSQGGGISKGVLISPLD